MYVHIGGEYSILDTSIICILDFEKVSLEQKDLIDLINKYETVHLVDYVSSEIPRSVIITDEKIYFSPISSRTIGKRTKTFF